MPIWNWKRLVVGRKIRFCELLLVLFGLYSIVALLYAQLPGGCRRSFGVCWPGKTHAAFSDAIIAVRRCLWVEWAFVTHGQNETFAKLSRPLRELLLFAITQAA